MDTSQSFVPRIIRFLKNKTYSSNIFFKIILELVPLSQNPSQGITILIFLKLKQVLNIFKLKL